MTPEIYRLLHVAGALLLFLGLGGVLAAGGKEGGKPAGLFMALHGVGLLVMIVAGFGLKSKAVDPPIEWGNWLYAKIGIWVLIAAVPVLIRKGILPRFVALLLVVALGTTAVWLAQAKPF